MRASPGRAQRGASPGRAQRGQAVTLNAPGRAQRGQSVTLNAGRVARQDRGGRSYPVAMSVPGALSLAADMFDPLTPPPRPPRLAGREPVIAPTDEAGLAAVCAVLRNNGGLQSVAAAQGMSVVVLEELAALYSDPGRWWG
jgi:hypothetical protein